MCSIMRGQRGLKSAISIGLSEGGGLQHLHPLSQEAIYPTSPRTPRQRLRSIPNINLQENRRRRPNFRQIQMHQFRRFLLPVKRFGIFHGRLSFVLGSNYHPCRQKYRGLVVRKMQSEHQTHQSTFPRGRSAVYRDFLMFAAFDQYALRFRKTSKTVFIRIWMSSHKLQLLMYQRSILTRREI